MAGENVRIIDAVFRTRDGRKVYVEGVADCKSGRCRYPGSSRTLPIGDSGSGACREP